MPASPNHSYTTYTASPLGKLLDETLKKIATIKTTYLVDPKKDTSQDALEAAGLLNATETLFKILHNSILPKFNDGKVPGIPGLIMSIPDFIRLRNLKNDINAQENLLIAKISQVLSTYIDVAKTLPGNLSLSIVEQLETNKTMLFESFPKKHHKELEAILKNIKDQILALDLEPLRNEDLIIVHNHLIQHLMLELLTPRHPMTYELMQLMAELIRNAPDDFAEAFSFFNPKVITKLLANGIIAGQLKKHAGVHKLQHLLGTDADTPSYSFRVAQEDLVTHQIEETDRHLSQEYIDERKRLLSLVIAPVMRRYLAKYGEKHAAAYPKAQELIGAGFKAIKSEFARAEVLQALTKAEHDTLLESVVTVTHKAEAMFSSTIQPTVADIEDSLNEHDKTILLLTEKKAFYLSAPVDTLMAGPDKEGILAQFNEHKKQLLDVSYSTQPLPDTLRCATVGIQAVGGDTLHIGCALTDVINQSVKMLQEGRKFIIDRLQALHNESGDTLFIETLTLINLDNLQQNVVKTEEKITVLKEEKSKFEILRDTAEAQLSPLKESINSIAPQISQKIIEHASLQEKYDALVLQIMAISADIQTNQEKKTENTEHSMDYEKLRARLPQIQTILTTDLESTAKKPKVSFKEIDLIMDPENKSTKAHRGFFELLKALDKSIIPQWSDYLEKQQSLLKANPTPIEFKKIINALLQLIDIKIPVIAQAIQQNTEKNTLLDENTVKLQADTLVIDTELQPVFNQKSQLEIEIATFNTLTTNITRLEKDRDAAVVEIERLDKERHSLENSNYVLKQQIEIIADLSSLQTLVGEVLDNTSISALSPAVTRLKIASDLLSQKIITTSTAIDKLEETTLVEAYQSNITAINKMQGTINQKMEQLSKDAAVQQDQIDQALKKTHREALVGDTKSALDNYVVKRTSKYYIKDFFSSKDKDARETFIDRLQCELNRYNETGDSVAVLKTIRDNITKFPGKHLKPILNTITASLFDANDYTTANDSQGYQKTERHEAAQTALKSLDDKDPIYTQLMNNLYEKIEQMKRYGFELTKNKDTCGIEVSNLAEKLSADTDQFILSNKHGENPSLPIQQKYDEFREKFMARLHSKDDVMYEHRNKWLQIVGNIALILLVIPQLIYSKCRTGQCSFFFEKPKQLKLIDAIDSELPLEITALSVA